MPDHNGVLSRWTDPKTKKPVYLCQSCEARIDPKNKNPAWGAAPHYEKAPLGKTCDGDESLFEPLDELIQPIVKKWAEDNFDDSPVGDAGADTNATMFHVETCEIDECEDVKPDTLSFVASLIYSGKPSGEHAYTGSELRTKLTGTLKWNGTPTGWKVGDAEYGKVTTDLNDEPHDE